MEVGEEGLGACTWTSLWENLADRLGTSRNALQTGLTEPWSGQPASAM